MNDAPAIVDDRLSDAAIAAELERRQRQVGAPAAAASAATVPALAWTLGGMRHAILLADVDGVSGAVPTTAVPGTPAALIGVFGRRGVIHTLFDPGAVLGTGASGTPNDAGAVIVLRQARPRIAIRVDAADGILDLPADAIEQADARIVRMVVLPDGTTVAVVDMRRLIGHLTGQSPMPSPEG